MIVTFIPACLFNARMSCEDLAECVNDISEDLRCALYDRGSRDIVEAWGSFTAQEQAELADAAEAEERRCAGLFLQATAQS